MTHGTTTHRSQFGQIRLPGPAPESQMDLSIAKAKRFYQECVLLKVVSEFFIIGAPRRTTLQIISDREFPA